ncbi:MAG: protein kinase, partial [Chloroflexi bacterium]|nr:protein kinase [Chloroflexota bacterium]
MSSPPVTIKTPLNQFRIEEFIALTPFGELYRASDERTNRPVALTVLPKAIAENPETLRGYEANSVRFQNLSHPNLNKLLGLQKTPTQAFLLEEWIDGPSLKTIQSRGRLNESEAVFLAKSICAGLEALHKQNRLHAHLAPELIRLNQRGEVIVCGLAGSRAIQSIAETRYSKYPALYTAPEQLRGEALTTAADIYSLAVILYELISGHWINGKSAPKTSDAIRKTHLDLPPPAPAALNPSLPDHFSRMIVWALRKNPDERLKTTIEFSSALALAAHTPLDQVPLRVKPETAPVLAGALGDWEFLPPPKATAVSTDTIPLEERLAGIANPSNKRKQSIGFVPILLLVVLAGFVSLFFFIRPAEEIPLPTPILFTPFAADSTAPPPPSPTPRPTLTNGGRIVFTCTRGDYNQLCMVNRDGTDFVQLTDVAASNYYPVFTPDAISILFASNRAGPNFDFFILNFVEREIFQLTINIGNVISPDFSPDGRMIVFANKAGDTPTSIWMMNADGLNARRVYTGTGNIVSVAWSPDGEKIAYAMNTGTPQEYEIFTMDTSGRNHLKISQGLQGIGGSVDFSPQR